MTKNNYDNNYRKDNLNFNYEKKLYKLSVSFNRIAFIFSIFFLIFIIYSFKVIFLANSTIITNKKVNINSNFRSSIVDRNGNILAKSVITRNVGIDPKQVIDKNKLILNLKFIFPDINHKEISKKLNKNKFFYLKKKVSPENFNKLFMLGDKSIKEEQKITRIYPQGNLFSHILGQIDDDNNGISGIEKYFDDELRSSKTPLKLSLDTNLQYLIRQELQNFSSIFNYVGSASILMNINNGQILSMISLPDFDLNKRKNINDLKYINRATKAVYELGSVFKTFTYAAGLNEGVIDTSTEFTNLEKKISCGKNIIGEYDNEIPNNLTAEEILIRSGNIGSVRIGQKLGIDKYRDFLNKLGLLEKINFDIEEIGEPISIKWGKCKLVTSSYGHGITTTPIQLISGYAAISNGGYKIQPTLIFNKYYNKLNNEKIIKSDVSNKVNSTLRKVVSKETGTAGFANIPGFEVGGKTGTAQKIVEGNYSDKKINTFVSIFPIPDPKYALLVLLDEPKANKEYIYNYRDGSNLKYKGNWRNTAGWTSVEISGKILEKIGPILATKY